MKKCSFLTLDQPRERMAKKGIDSLSNAELLAIVLRTGRVGEPVITLAHRLLVQMGGLKGIASSEWQELSQLQGIGGAKAMSIKAAVELATRFSKEEESESLLLDSPLKIIFQYSYQMEQYDRETLIALHLDTKKRLISEEVVAIGTLNASLVHPREVFRKAVKQGAAAIVLLHNHPSGDPTPSPEDIQVTKRLKEVGKLMGIPLLDHFVIGNKTYRQIEG